LSVIGNLLRLVLRRLRRIWSLFSRPVGGPGLFVVLAYGQHKYGGRREDQRGLPRGCAGVEHMV
jgi:hypothetical protein